MEMNEVLRDCDSQSSSGSDSGSTCEEERLRELFLSCDADGDGFIDSNDLVRMCERLNMQDAVNDLHQQLGMDHLGRISFQQFLVCRDQLMGEIEAVQADHECTSPPYNPAWRISITASESTNPDHIYETIPETIEIPTMTSLLEKFHPDVHSRVTHDKRMVRYMEVIDQIHVKCLQSMKTDYMELTNRNHQIRTERELLDKQLNKLQSEHLTEQTVHQQRLDQMSCRYEERITELHSVIAELQKKFERSSQFNIIREEEEVVEDDASNKSEFSNTDNLATSLSLEDDSALASINRVVSELECSETESDNQKVQDSPRSRDAESRGDHHHVTRVVVNQSTGADWSPPGHVTDTRSQPAARRSVECGAPREARELSPPPPVPPPRAALSKPEVSSQEQKARELRRENEHLKAYVRDLERRLEVDELVQPLSDNENKASEADVHSQFTVAKVAGLKKLKTTSPKKARDVHSMNLDLVSPGLPSSKLAEHLSASVQDCSNIQEMLAGVESGDEVEDKVRGFQVEMERLTSQIDHLKAQNDVLYGTLEESKCYSDRLTVLFSKFESNMIALKMANEYADNLLEWYEVLCGLLDIQLQLQLNDTCLDDDEAVYTGTRDLICARRALESRARCLLAGLEGAAGLEGPDATAHDLTEKMSVAYSLSTSPSSSATSVTDPELAPHELQRLKLHINALKSSRVRVWSSSQELESLFPEPALLAAPEAHRLDLENAVIMQEMMALKEEKSELKSQNYLLVREKKAIELRLNNKDLQEQSYQVQICHLKCEIKDLTKAVKELRYKKSTDKDEPAYSRSDVSGEPASQLVSDLIETQRREEKLRRRVYDLVTALEKLSRESDARHKQYAEFVNDLKKANSSLIASFERAKKKYQTKVKKLELQLLAQKEMYEAKLQERLVRSASSSGSEDHASHRPRAVNQTSL